MTVPKTVYDSISEILREFPQAGQYLRKCFLVGSTIIGEEKTWSNDNDIDFYYYENSSKRRKNLNKLIEIVSSRESGLDFDFLQLISTDNYRSIIEPEKKLTRHVFEDKRDCFSEKKGVMRFLNLDGFFITKLASMCDRHSENDYKALEAVYKMLTGFSPGNKENDRALSPEIQDTIKEFQLEECLDMVHSHCNQH